MIYWGKYPTRPGFNYYGAVNIVELRNSLPSLAFCLKTQTGGGTVISLYTSSKNMSGAGMIYCVVLGLLFQAFNLFWLWVFEVQCRLFQVSPSASWYFTCFPLQTRLQVVQYKHLGPIGHIRNRLHKKVNGWQCWQIHRQTNILVQPYFLMPVTFSPLVHIPDSVPCVMKPPPCVFVFPTTPFLFSSYVAYQLPLWLPDSLNSRLRLWLAAPFGCRLLLLLPMRRLSFPSERQIKFWLTQRNDTGGLSDSEQAAPALHFPTVGFPAWVIGFFLCCCCFFFIFPPAAHWWVLVAISPFSFILTSSFLLISATVKLKVCRIKIWNGASKHPLDSARRLKKLRRRGKWVWWRWWCQKEIFPLSATHIQMWKTVSGDGKTSFRFLQNLLK